MDLSTQALQSFVPCLNQAGPKVLVHVGAGSPNGRPLPECFQDDEWAEVRVDINPAARPNIVASVTDMAGVPTAGADAVFSSHTHEHLDDHEAEQGFEEVFRVLKPGGFLLINVPDLAQIAELILQGQADEVLYDSKAGPIRPIDMLFGHQASLKSGNGYMAHRTGFTAQRLQRFCFKVGFNDVRVRAGGNWDLWGVAVK
ncbi:class I SAM-dependent methyltransferase [Orrella daihaiensis]|uniref:Class I SAM-dependent methyltransferase n=1 Tax=Orrella daihaiensis TaxID=2782176 RepID=A0ABY4AMB5_9BURK|nr:class I SAM-dependent methyltransferase [Orrella daihaiensis]UOD51418.1 class I SAM-dependent methyltransferase [Orrella daihaiensis]